MDMYTHVCRQHSQLLLQVADLAPELQDLLVDLGRRAVGASQVLGNNWGHVTTTHTILGGVGGEGVGEEGGGGEGGGGGGEGGGRGGGREKEMQEGKEKESPPK